MGNQAAPANESFYDDDVNSGEFSSRNVLLLALGVEGGLLIAALLGGWWFELSPWTGMSGAASSTASAVFSGVLAGLLLTVAGIGLERLPGRTMREFRTFVHTQIAPVFAECSLSALALIAFAAGLGEEVFFRGFLQQGLSLLLPGVWGSLAAVAIAALLFGVCHSLTRLYFILATIGGALFGGLYLWSGHIATPVIAHGLYDFLILLYLMRRRR